MVHVPADYLPELERVEALRAKYNPAIDLFSEAMRREMRANEQKAGWSDTRPKELVADLTYHAAKLARAVYEGKPTRLIEHAADVANLAWMVADAARVLDEKTVRERACERDLMEWTPDELADMAKGGHHSY